MTLYLGMPSHTTAGLSPITETAVPRFLDSIQLEFHAALQLLNERACSIAGASGSAIALEQNGVFSYSTAAGTFDRDPGTEVAANSEPFRECFAHLHPVEFASDGAFRLLVPVLRDGKAVGFVEVVSATELGDETEDALKHLADLVSVALEHRDAAERAERASFDERSLLSSIPMRWHAPDIAAEEPKTQARSIRNPYPQHIKTEETPTPQPPVVPDVRSCSACGFPVSTGRALCVDCEQKPHAAARPAILELEKEESWISAHGYTIASLIVSALTAAIILWLRR